MKSKCELGSNSSDGMLPLKFVKRWGFHADLGAAMLKEPVTAGLAVIIESGKPHFLVSGNAYDVSSGDTDNVDFFGHPYQHSYGERYVA